MNPGWHTQEVQGQAGPPRMASCYQAALLHWAVADVQARAEYSGGWHGFTCGPGDRQALYQMNSLPPFTLVVGRLEEGRGVSVSVLACPTPLTQEPAFLLFSLFPSLQLLWPTWASRCPTASWRCCTATTWQAAPTPALWGPSGSWPRRWPETLRCEQRQGVAGGRCFWACFAHACLEASLRVLKAANYLSYLCVHVLFDGTFMCWMCGGLASNPLLSRHVDCGCCMSHGCASYGCAESSA